MGMLVAVILAWLPGLVAERRNHRHPVIVTILGVITLWIHPVLWLLVLLWAWKGNTSLDVRR